MQQTWSSSQEEQIIRDIVQVVTHIPNGTTKHLYLMFADSYT